MLVVAAAMAPIVTAGAAALTTGASFNSALGAVIGGNLVSQRAAATGNAALGTACAIGAAF